MTQLIQGVTIKPYTVNKEEARSISFSVLVSFKTDKLKAPFRFIKSLYKKSVLNDFKSIFSASVE